MPEVNLRDFSSGVLHHALRSRVFHWPGAAKWDRLTDQQSPGISPHVSANITSMPPNWLDVGSVDQVQVFRVVKRSPLLMSYFLSLYSCYLWAYSIYYKCRLLVLQSNWIAFFLSHRNYEILFRLDSETAHDQCNSLSSLYDSNNPLNQI